MPETLLRSIDTSPKAEGSSVSDTPPQDRIRTALDRQARALVLRALEQAPGYCMNSRILEHVLDGWALTFTHPELVALLEWLDRESLVTLRCIGNVVVVTLREKGFDVARGRDLHEGVERPLPPP